MRNNELTTTNNLYGTKLWPDYLTDLAVADYGHEDKDILAWFAEKMDKEGISIKEAGELINYNHIVLRRVYAGKYPATIEHVINNLRNYRAECKLADANSGQPPYVQTGISDLLWGAAEYATENHRPVHVIGNTQRGKTRALEELQRRKGKHVVLVRVPSGPSPCFVLRQFVKDLGSKGRQLGRDDCWEYLYRNLTPEHLIVWDEMHQIAMVPVKKALVIIEMIREIYDRFKCGMLLIGTDVWGDKLKGDSKWSGVLEQFVKRGKTIRLSENLYEKDIERFWLSYQLPTPTAEEEKEIRRIANWDGIGIFTQLLQDGQKIANRRGEPFEWGHFFKAQAVSEKAEKGDID